MIFITSDHVSLHYEIDGEGFPLILLNGMWGDTTSWDKQVPTFSKHFRCIRLDHRGVAQSERWVGSYSYELHARDIHELVRHLNIDKMYIAGVCHGAMAAITYAIHYPQDLQGLIINGIQALQSIRQQEVFAGWKRIVKSAGFEVLYRSVILPSIMSEDFFQKNIQKISEIVRATAARVDLKSAIGLIEAAIDYGYTGEEIEKIHIPALIMSGEEDLFSPPYSVKSLHNCWKGSQYYEFKNCGHFPQRERSDEYNEVVLRFIKDGLI